MNGRPELLSIIVPVFNEVRTVRAVVDRMVVPALPAADDSTRAGLPVTTEYGW